MSLATHPLAPQQARQLERRVNRGVFVAGFLVFLAIALVSQLLTMQWRSWLPGAESEKSLIGGVKSAVYTFMSHLT